MRLRMMAVVPFVVLALAGCGEDPEVAAAEQGSDVEGRVSMDKSDVEDAARDACGAVPLQQLADELNVDAPRAQTIADRFAEPWPEELRDVVRDGCLAGLEGS